MKTLVEFDTAIGTSNLGDEIILSCLREEMDFLFRDSFIMRFGTHVKNIDKKWYYKGNVKLDFAYQADFKLVMGTNLLSRDIKQTQLQWPIGRLDSWLYKDCIMAGVGTTLAKGPATNYSRKLYQKILRKDFYHSVRDEDSKELLESMGFQAINTGCPTLWKLTPEFCREIPKKKASRVIFSLSGYKAQRDPVFDQQLLTILKNSYDEMIFWCQTSRDELYLERFEGTENIPRICSLEQFAKALDEGDVDYVGTRLHGGVFAMRHKVRSIVISIDHRARGFHETNNLVICEREEIPQKLKQMIFSEFATEIRLPQEEIDTWKEQFRKDYPDREIVTHESLFRIRLYRGTRKVYQKIKKAPKQLFKKGKNKASAMKHSNEKKTRAKRDKAKYDAMMQSLPINEKQVLFFTFQGDYTCNPKYISEEMFRRKLPMKQIWVTLEDPEAVRDHFPEKVELVRFGTEEYYRAMATSKVWIDNAFNFPKGYILKKPEQVYIETMHGSLGIKKIGPEVIPNPARNAKGRLCGEMTDVCISNSTFENMVYETSFWRAESIQMLGHARNDILFLDEVKQKEIREKVFRYFELDSEDTSIRLALYAPTFRNESEHVEYEPLGIKNVKDSLEERFGGTWYLLWRAHHSGSQKPEGLLSCNVLDAGTYPDIQELMIATDFGITDYSSWIFDYVLTRKRGLLYTPDIANYDMKRGFYYPIQEAPFPIAENNEDVKKQILGFDDAVFADRVEEFLNARGCMDDGHASERITDFIQSVACK